MGLPVVTRVFPPPPPRKGLAMRPKLNGDDAAAFWAMEQKSRRKWKVEKGLKWERFRTTYHALGPAVP